MFIYNYKQDFIHLLMHSYHIRDLVGIICHVILVVAVIFYTKQNNGGFYSYTMKQSLLLCQENVNLVSKIQQGGMEHQAVYYCGPRFFLIRWQLLGLLFNFYGLVHWMRVQTFQPLDVIYSKCNFVYHAHISRHKN